MNAAQQKIVDEWWDEMAPVPIGGKFDTQIALVNGKFITNLIHRILATQDTGDKYGNDLRNEYKRGFRDRGKKVDDRLATQDTGERCSTPGCLRPVMHRRCKSCFQQ